MCMRVCIYIRIQTYNIILQYPLINHILISYTNLILPYSIQSSKSSPSFLSQMNDASMVFAGLWASSRQCRVPGLGSRVNASQQ